MIGPLIDRPAPGLVTAMLASSLAITPLAALSRPVAGLIHRPVGAGTGSLVITLPGSPKAAKENLEALLRVLPHALELSGGARSRTTEVHQRIERGQDGLGAEKTTSQGVSEPREASAAGSTSPALGHTCGHHHHHGGHGHHAPQPRTLLSHDPSVSGEQHDPARSDGKV